MHRNWTSQARGQRCSLAKLLIQPQLLQPQPVRLWVTAAVSM